jgi:DNA-binding CsgD family transcriptional regulator
LHQVRAKLADHGCAGLVLAGQAGVGLTRFGSEALRLAADHGMETARVSANEAASTIPFGAVAPLLRSPLDPALPQGEWLRHYAEALLNCTDGTRLALLVDDAHLLDPASAALMHHIARAQRAFVMVTITSGLACPDAVRRLWTDDLLARMDLEPLSRDAVVDVLTAALGDRVANSAVAHFYDRSAGDIGLLRELVFGALRTGVLARDGDGPWTLTAPAPLSGRLMELVNARLGSLDADERSYLEVIAVAEPAGAAEIQVAGDPSIADRLQKRGLLSGRREGRRVELRFVNPLHREVVCAQIPAMRWSTIAGRLAKRLQAKESRSAEDVVRIAMWQLDAGGATTEMLIEAAELARWRFDFPLAERLARAATEDGGGFEAEILLGQVAGMQGRVGEAESLFGRLASQNIDDDQRGRLAVARIDNLTYDLGRLSEALAIADRTQVALSSTAWGDEVAARRLGLLLAINGPAVAADAGEALVARASGRALAWGCVELAYSWGRLGRINDALAVSDRGYRVHQELIEPFEWSCWMHRFLHCENLGHAGDLNAINKLAADEYEHVVRSGDTETEAFFALYLAKGVGDRGHVNAAVERAEEALALFRRLGRQQMIRFGLTYLALARALAGQPDAAAAALQEIDEMGLPPNYLTGVDLFQARAWTLVAAGDIIQARTILDRAAATAARIGDQVGEAAALHAVARLGGAPTGLPRLNELSAIVDGQLVNARAAHVAALSVDDAEGLGKVSELFESMGADLLAAEASADAAVGWRRAGDPQRAAAASRRAHLLAYVGGCAVTPALANLDARLLLTKAQRDVGQLAAAGRTNREIADQLAVSVRTVENHMQQVYRKLGVHRSELARALAESQY